MQQQILDRLAQGPCSIGDMIFLCVGVSKTNVGEMNGDELLLVMDFMSEIKSLLKTGQIKENWLDYGHGQPTSGFGLK